MATLKSKIHLRFRKTTIKKTQIFTLYFQNLLLFILPKFTHQGCHISSRCKDTISKTRHKSILKTYLRAILPKTCVIFEESLYIGWKQGVQSLQWSMSKLDEEAGKQGRWMQKQFRKSVLWENLCQSVTKDLIHQTNGNNFASTG